MSASIDKDKARIRREVKKNLSGLQPDAQHAASVKICTRLANMDEFIAAHTVMLYMPLAGEVDITPLALQSFRKGKSVCVPKVNWARRDMMAVEVHSIDDRVMDTDEHGVRVPRDGRPIPPTLIDLVIVPGLAFDASGRRLGRGGGYYDRFLARLRPSVARIGVGFDVQIVDEVPATQRDVAVHMVVTDRRVMHADSTRTRH